MEMKVTDAFRPDWERWVGVRPVAHRRPSTPTPSRRPARSSTRSISPADAEGMFDILTYEKGAAVVRMLEQYLGEERFREGIRRYMTAHAYGNTETTDLWDAIEAATGEPVRRIMDSWIFQGGHPIVTRRGSTPTAACSTSPRSASATCPTPRRSTPAGPCPLQLRYGTASGEVVTTTVLLDGDELEIDLPEAVTWVVGNAEGHGFYRVRTSAPLREALVAQRARPHLSDVERYGLVDDTWASVLAGSHRARGVRGDGRGLRRRGRRVRVAPHRSAGSPRSTACLAPDDRPALQARVPALVGPALERLGWEPRDGEPTRDRELRGPLIGAAVTLAADPDAAARGPRAVRARAGRRPRWRPTWPAPCCGPSPPCAGPRTIGAHRGGLPGRPHPAGGAALPVRAGRGPRPGAVRAGARAGHLQRGAHAERAVPARRLHGEPRQRPHARGPRSRDGWDELNERFPSNSIARMLNGIRALSRPRRRRRRRGVPRRPPASRRPSRPWPSTSSACRSTVALAASASRSGLD